MSRIPQPSSSRTTANTNTSTTPATPTRPRVLNAITSTPTARVRTQSSTPRAGGSTPTAATPKPSAPTVRKTGSTLSLKTKVSTPKPSSPTKTRPPPNINVSNHAAPDKVPGTPSVSIREAIALKRAEAKKAQARSGGGGLDTMSMLEDELPPHAIPTQEEEDLLGRASLRETIEKARSTGSLNLATRSLMCLPSAVFEIHLNITPEPLKSVPEESPLPPVPETTTGKSSKKNPAWFEAQDLQVLKAWSNEIQEIQHEISLFGSLKVVDVSIVLELRDTPYSLNAQFHNNKLTSIPDSLADLSMLTNLDLSHNRLTVLPNIFFALPELTNLSLSHNALTTLPFNAYFASSGSRSRNNHNKSTGFFAPEIIRATSPLPKLLILDISHNKLTAESIDLILPKSLIKIDLSDNPLGSSQSLLKTLATLPRLKEVLIEKADIGDESFPSDFFPISLFPSLKVLDLTETRVTLDTVCTALKNMKQELNHDFTRDEPPEGITRIIVGKKVIKETWELELERRAQHRVNKSYDLGGDWDEPSRPTSVSPAPSTSSNVNSVRSTTSSRATRNIQEVVKEAWEIEAEAGLMTEGGRRRARAAAASAQDGDNQQRLGDGIGMGQPSALSRSPSISNLTLSSPQYYDAPTQTLILPPSQPPKPAGHNRTFSLATKMTATSVSRADIAVPVHSLPLNVIAVQSFAHSLRSLTLANRRADRSFALPSSAATDAQGFLPCLEELDLEGCNLSDTVHVLRADAPSPTVPPSSPPANARTTEPLLPLLATLFPGLRTLNLSYNGLTSAAVVQECLSTLILSSPVDSTREDGATKKGLRHLRLQGNRITDLDGFMAIAGMFKGNRDVPEWKLEELDLRDNEIGRLPPEIGLLPLDVFLVDGNT
ncbi:L domain-like protein [Macrolepiota fuliginosa MF-IS2]|uniref:L domain-like protein n=1 Tax=Macrolepiota fuliginosa MF-IS2 TaxID=1400762 RepID=A0A9P5XET9_9AGAR|nr:L domain-like protein [Macrolepiota fuliginosa MF-IS2]